MNEKVGMRKVFVFVFEEGSLVGMCEDYDCMDAVIMNRDALLRYGFSLSMESTRKPLKKTSMANLHNMENKKISI
jgi:hypothetical protein